ncbi:t-SNARE [Stachybotrys elegans]|uniref:t-SNARE n=1 Tax=Stachybotrys elegans TaxID=80388 RepID=A0A8K0SUR6_9HYPO|nr:t-SNARE [Stachybotrys elegans]
MSYGYGGSNPYDQRDAAPGGYNRQYDNYGGGSNVEMAPLTQNAGNMSNGDPNAILNECRDIDRGIDEVERNLESLRMLQQRTLDDADSSSSSASNRQLDGLSSETMALYRTLTDRVRTVKSNPESRSPKNGPQVGRVDRRLKQAIQQYQQVESQFRKRTQDQMARQYRIVRPDASPEEVRDAVEDPNGGQIFSQALMQSDRQGRARAALSAVQDRHAALQKIERQMEELAQLFQDMDTLVVQQEAAIVQIEQKGEEVVENLDKGNEEIGVAVNTARKTRKKKWICLGICVAIIVVVVIIVLIYVFVIQPQNNNNGGGNNNSKRGLEHFPIVDFAATVTAPKLQVRAIAQAIRDSQAPEQVVRLARERIHFPQLAN